MIDAGRGYGRACLMATVNAVDADIMVFMDGDGADDPASIAALVAPIRSGDYDFVIGSRVRGEREPGSIAWHQIGAGLAAGYGMRLLYGVRYTDMCAFRAIRRDALLALDMREMTYGWNIEMQMRAARAGLRILEVPVPYRCRSGGSSKVAGSLGGTLRAGARIVATFVRVSSQRPADGARPALHWSTIFIRKPVPTLQDHAPAIRSTASIIAFGSATPLPAMSWALPCATEENRIGVPMVERRRGVLRQQLGGDVALVVQHDDEGVEAWHVKHRVGAERAGDVEALGRGRIDRGLDDVDLLAAEQPAFAGMRVQAR